MSKLSSLHKLVNNCMQLKSKSIFYGALKEQLATLMTKIGRMQLLLKKKKKKKNKQTNNNNNNNNNNNHKSHESKIHQLYLIKGCKFAPL